MADIASFVRKLSNVSTIFKDRETELKSLEDHANDKDIELNQNSSIKRFTLLFNIFEKMKKLLSFLRVEERGIERVPSDERTDLKIINTAMIWVGANIMISTFATGTLGPAVFNLTLYQSFITIIIFNIVGIIPIGFMACFGPPSGLRTMVFSRFSWGYYGASIIAVLNCINTTGWAAVNSITAAQTLRVVANDHLPLFVGIIIIGIASFIISFVGYKWIHIYERYCWIPMLIGYCIIAGVGAKYFTNSPLVSTNQTISTNTRLEISRILSFGTAVYGVSVSWCSYAGDYNTYFPENTNQFKIFLLTFLGSFISIVPLELLGAAVYTGTYTNPHWQSAYEKNNVGGLLGATLSSLRGFGKFILILLSLSTVAANILNVYSLSLSVQVVAPIFRRVPRIFCTVIGTIIYIILGSVAANRFNHSLISFLELLSYWCTLFLIIVFEDFVIFRRCSYRNYNFTDWTNRHLLPVSFAAILAGLVGVVGIIVGMSQIWYSGPIAKAIGGYNNQQDADVGWELGFIFTGTTYPLFRYIELHFLKR